jgi:hypothetical protein
LMPFMSRAGRSKCNCSYLKQGSLAILFLETAPPSRVFALVNVLTAGVNNPFALLDITNCPHHLARVGKKDVRHIANIVMPLIKQMESELDVHNKKCPRIVDLVFFDGGSNVQNAGKILKAFNPSITVGHGAEHVVSLFFF